MRQELVNANADLVSEHSNYVVRITGDSEHGARDLDKFIDPESPYPVIATTSKLLTTGVDTQTVKLIVIDQNINSIIEFKQIIGRGTRVREDYGKMFFTIMDFRGATE
jgi:type I restriction enzyme R subunit